MIRFAAYPLLIVLCVSALLRAEGECPPSELMVEGAGRLPTAAHARRTHLLGAIEIYSIAVYADGSMLDLARLASPDVAKALRIEIAFEEDPRQPFPFDWRRELVPTVDAAGTAHLRGSFAPLRRGDVISLEYVPGRGTSVRVNKGVVVSAAHHDLMLTFLDHWLGQRPVSEEIKKSLLGS